MSAQFIRCYSGDNLSRGRAILAPGEIKILIHETNWASCHTYSHRVTTFTTATFTFLSSVAIWAAEEVTQGWSEPILHNNAKWHSSKWHSGENKIELSKPNQRISQLSISRTIICTMEEYLSHNFDLKSLHRVTKLPWSGLKCDQMSQYWSILSLLWSSPLLE